jgi:hypothetical protein
MPKIDKVEYERRIRMVQEWLIDDWPYQDIITQIKSKWDIEIRQAKRYVAEAREQWTAHEQGQLDQKRKMKVESLKKLKRSLKEIYKGTPIGIRSILQVEKEIITLEGLRPATKIDLSGSLQNNNTNTNINLHSKPLTKEAIQKIAEALENEV